MLRRNFLALLRGLPLALAPVPAPAFSAPPKPAPIHLQDSPIAGFQYHDGEAAWPLLKVGLRLRLVREAGNRHDTRAVAIYAGSHKLGYVPRIDNCAVCQLLDRGQPLIARISALSNQADPWQRVRVAIWLNSPSPDHASAGATA